MRAAEFSLVVGVGMSTGATSDEVLALVEACLAEAAAVVRAPKSSWEYGETSHDARTPVPTTGVTAPSATEPPRPTALATLDTKVGEPGLVRAAARLGVPVLGYPARELAAVPVPHHSAAPRSTVGTPSVAEAAALFGGGQLLVPKRKSARTPARVTCAVALRTAPPGDAGTAGAEKDRPPTAVRTSPLGT